MNRLDNAKLSAYLRNFIVGVNTKVPLLNGGYTTAINFDNAATTPPFCTVLNAINDFCPWYSSIHRGKGYKSVLSSDIYDEGRDFIRKFVKADKDKDVIIYTKNTTESINMLAYTLTNPEKEQVVLTTEMEHLANDLPWRDKFKVDYVQTNKEGKLSIKDLEDKLIKYNGKVILVTVTGASNVTGYMNPIYEIAKIAHKYGAKILIDGAQLVPHAQINMKPYDSAEHLDYLVFSAHKMYAPFGLGVLIGPKETFSENVPVYQGGGDVRLVSRNFIEWHDPPDKDEAGTPNVIGVCAMTTAIKTLNDIGMDVLHKHETDLINYALERIKCVPDIELYSNSNQDEQKVSLLTFNIKGIHHGMLAKILSHEAGIAVRNGLFCAHLYVEKLLGLDEKKLAYYHKNHNVPLPGMVRMSFGLYNNYKEIDICMNLLERIARNKSYYKNLYRNIK